MNRFLTGHKHPCPLKLPTFQMFLSFIPWRTRRISYGKVNTSAFVPKSCQNSSCRTGKTGSRKWSYSSPLPFAPQRNMSFTRCCGPLT
jgi:hypothetical protein